MLTLKQLKDMPPGTIFSSGTSFDLPGGLFMSNSGKELRWVAERGEIHDWTIYCHFSFHDNEWIRRYGDKVYSESHIKMCVPCDNEAYKMYRR